MLDQSRMFPGTTVEVPPRLQEISLDVVADHVITMKGNKAIGFLPMHPIEHLVLTTVDDAHVDELINRSPDRKGKKITLAKYNEFARTGDNILPPFLRVQMADGRVVGHEGRHRAAALHREDPQALMWVAIELIDETGHSAYYEEPEWVPGAPPPGDQRRYLGAEDMPRVFIGQFRPIMVEVMPETLWPIVRG